MKSSVEGGHWPVLLLSQLSPIGLSLPSLPFPLCHAISIAFHFTSPVLSAQ